MRLVVRWWLRVVARWVGIPENQLLPDADAQAAVAAGEGPLPVPVAGGAPAVAGPNQQPGAPQRLL